ncbi:hypothetical protein V5E97_06140 [Singulisphaera sp. Ch08]|uniref:DUF1700 domain-containing protein n=1 Tax=Singulisphaera sp. Ch08 TaxID=3120278 RepID=A0AAU7CKI7_9BACT
MSVTTMTTGRLPRPLQKLVDARLDTIDRMLLGRLPRADRLAVTRDVEGQIFDLLGERPGFELDREDVLTVLTQLDPPEAYIPEEGGYEAAAVLMPSSAVALTRRSATPAVTPVERKRATAIGIIGLVILVLVVLWPAAYALAISAESPVLMYGLLVAICLVLGASVPTLVLSILWRRGGNWSTVGIVGGAIGLVAPLMGGVILLFVG